VQTKVKKAASVKANEAGVEEAGNFFDESSKDEARHAKTLEGLLKRYF